MRWLQSDTAIGLPSYSGSSAWLMREARRDADSAPVISKYYLYLNAALYALFAVWCTVKAGGTASSLGYRQLSNGGHSEYLVIYGGLQLGLALMFALLARDAGLHRTGILIALCLYGPIVLYRAITVARFWPVSTLTWATGVLELALLLAALWIYRSASAAA